MAEFLLAGAGVVLLTLGILRVAACRYARHTKDLIEQGWKDLWL